MLYSSTVAFSALMAIANGMAMSPNPIIPRALSGKATFYGGNLNGGACSFSTMKALPAGVFGTALSATNWANSAECGACISVTGPSGNTITAMIVDLCPECSLNQLDLFPDAFAELSAPSVGVIETTWSYIDCPITTPLQLHNKDGVSAYWFSMQVVDANQAVSTLEVSSNGGSTWLPTTRQTYNFFEISSGAGSTVDIKVTAINGEIVIVKGVTVSSGTSVTASSNFGTSSAAPASVVASSSAKVAPIQSSTTPIVVVSTPATTEASTPSISGGAFVQGTTSAIETPSGTTATLSSSSTSVVVFPVSTEEVQATSASYVVSPIMSTSAVAPVSTYIPPPPTAQATSPILTVTVTSCLSSETSAVASSSLSPFYSTSAVLSSGVASSTAYSNYTVSATVTASPLFTGAASTVSGSLLVAGAAAIAAIFFA